MRSAWLLAVLPPSIALAGCLGFGEEREPLEQPPEEGGAPAGNETAPRNETEGNRTAPPANQTRPGNGAEPGNETANRMAAQPATLHNGTHNCTGLSPQDATFTVEQPSARLDAEANGSGLVVGLRVTLVDPSGTGTLVVSNASEGNAQVPSPARGTWTIEFEGTGLGDVEVVVRGS